MPVAQKDDILDLTIRASYEVDQMLGSGELIGKIQTSWDELLDDGDEPFNLSFPPVWDVHPSLTLKAGVVHTCDEQDSALSDPLVDCEIGRETDAGHARFAEYITSRTVSHLNGAVQRFQLVLDQCPVGHPDHAAALTNLAYARLEGYIRNDLQDIDTITSLLRKALDCVRRLCCKLLPLCPEGTYLRSIGVDSAVDYVIAIFQLTDPMKPFLCALRVILTGILPEQLGLSLKNRFDHQGKPNDLDEAIFLTKSTAPAACWAQIRDFLLDNLGGSLIARFNKRAISLHREALTLRPPGHPIVTPRLTTLPSRSKTRYDELDVSEDLNEAIDLYRESLRTTPPFVSLGELQTGIGTLLKAFPTYSLLLNWVATEIINTICPGSISSARLQPFSRARSLPVNATSCAYVAKIYEEQWSSWSRAWPAVVAGLSTQDSSEDLDQLIRNWHTNIWS
ncbi:hypothetical protein BDR07DRAFT_1565363 [Suillus spraguei]|nr:hypothetical protein BDR07DRAFT_1565363 [Suillus spraguei]